MRAARALLWNPLQLNVGVGQHPNIGDERVDSAGPSESQLNAARLAVLAALGTIHPSRRGEYAGILVGETARVLDVDGAAAALVLLPKPVSLRVSLRADRIIQLRITEPAASATATTLAQEAEEGRSDIEARYGNGHAIHLLARSVPNEILVSSVDFAEFQRSYHILRGGFAIDAPDAAARRQGAAALLVF